ncbi:hypothetical protein L1987_71824 [Smallanthus sonchifolius]|uniref:Uncharacterized protein n=1 Tax=Smallanthus sonchifolius TaxID=185202 RepID=A0ACB9AUD6_9ASTR|nr:hypothetical protein L1987_71824 [Smallanthus sonchifolius]
MRRRWPKCTRTYLIQTKSSTVLLKKKFYCNTFGRQSESSIDTAAHGNASANLSRFSVPCFDRIVWQQLQNFILLKVFHFKCLRSVLTRNS